MCVNESVCEREIEKWKKREKESNLFGFRIFFRRQMERLKRIKYPHRETSRVPKRNQIVSDSSDKMRRTKGVYTSTSNSGLEELKKFINDLVMDVNGKDVDFKHHSISFI